MRIIVLGCGPAGLLAAWGAEQAGLARKRSVGVEIVSIKKKSPMAGAQFVHEPIPGLSVKPESLTITKLGDRPGYAQKVYGDPNHKCSWENYEEGTIPCWSMAAVYEELWSHFEPLIMDEEIGPEFLRISHRLGAALMISSIPAPVLCELNHTFESQEVLIDVFPSRSKKNVIMYDGDPEHEWYRFSRMYGQAAYEYGSKEAAGADPSHHLVRIKKPQHTNCNCRPNIMRVGRYGKWLRGVLVHNAYQEAYSAVYKLL